MLIEGRNPVKEALSGDNGISKLYIQKGIHDTESIIALANKNKIRINFADKSVMDKLSTSGKHQGLIAVAEDFKYSSIEEITDYAAKKNEKLFLLILDGIEDPHNLGSILRVAECAGVHGVVIPNRRAVSVNETVVKVSAGASSFIKVAMVTNINDLIRKLKDNFVNVVCADMDGGSMYDTSLTGDTAIVIGGEGNGVKQLTRKLCDSVISIPQYGKINSLNASVATGIIAYEAVRQRMCK